MILYGIKNGFIYIGIFVLIYIYWQTGVHSDDWILINQLRELSPIDVIFPDLSKLHVLVFGLPSYYFDAFQYYLFGTKYLLYDLVKVMVSVFSIYMIYTFSKDYISKQSAFLFSIIFLFFISHDSINYWTITQVSFLNLVFILYSHKLINSYKFIKGFFIGILGSFMGFGSPPYVLGLSVIFLYKKEYRKFFVFVLPQFIYIVYYFIISNVFEFSKGRIDEAISVSKILKQYILQMGTFIDSMIGPSFWLKIYYSLAQLSMASMIVGIVLVSIFYIYYKPQKEKVNLPFILSLIMIMLLAFGMYSLTGKYPQLAFNLGNRVTIYGTLLVVYLIVIFLMNSKKSAMIVFSIFIFSTLGTSDHWKDWNKTQMKIIDNMSKNKDLEQFDITKQLFISHNQFSKFGKISHIELFTEEPLAKEILKIATGKTYKVSTINRRFYYQDGQIIDKKYNNKLDVQNIVYIYDTNSDKLLKISKEKVQNYIDTLPEDKRHWLFLLDKDNFIMRFVLKLMPRLEYAI